MIQRIQTIYILLAALFMVLFYLLPIATFITDDFAFEFFNCHLTHPDDAKSLVTLIPLAILPSITVLISVISILLFKKRKIQMHLCKINMLLIATTIIVGVFYFLKIADLVDGSVQYGFAVIFPLLAFVTTAMANSAIKKDDDLVRSADRIR